MRSVERTVEEVLLPAVEALAGEDPPAAEYAVRLALRHRLAGRRAAGRAAGAPRRGRPDLRRVAAVRRRRAARAGARAGAAPRRAAHADAARRRSTPRGSRARCARSSRGAVVLTGRRASLDALGRLVYAARRGEQPVEVFDYRGALPDTGREHRRAARRLARSRRATLCSTPWPRPSAPPRSVRAADAARPAQSPAPEPAATDDWRLTTPGRHGRPRILRPCRAPPPGRPRPYFPELEEQVLERWRERDVFRESLRRREGAPAVGLLRGPADGQRPARAPTTCSRACSRTSSRATRRCAATTSSARAAGTATACRSRSRSSSSSGITSKADIEALRHRRVQRSSCRESVFELPRGLGRLTERIGFWVDLDDAYRTLDHDYIESVWWALQQIWDKGLLYEGHKVVPYCPRCGTALSSHEVAQGYQDVEDPSRLRALPGRRAGGRAARGRRAAGLDDHAVDARLQRRRRGRPGARPTCAHGRRGLRARRGAASSACSARTPRCSTASRARAASAPRYEPPFAFIARQRVRAERATPCCRPTSSPPRTAPASSTPRSPSARTTSASASEHGPERRQPGAARRHLRRAHRPVRRALRQGRRPRPRSRTCARAAGCCAPRTTSTPTRTAGAAARRCSTTPSRPGTSRTIAAARPAARGQRDRRLAPRAHQARPLRQLAGEQRRLGALARALLGHAAAGLALRRAGTSTASARFAELRGAVAASSSRTRTARTSTTSTFPCAECGERDAPRARGDRRLVRLGLDAVRPVARAVREPGALRGAASRPTSSARRSTRRAAGSTRCSRSRRCSSTASPYRERRLPRA